MVTELSGVSQIISNYTTQASSILLYLFIFAVFASVVAFILNYMSYNISVILKYNTKPHSYVIMKRGKVYTDKKTKISYLKLFNHKEIYPQPPPEAISLTAKGKRMVTLKIFGEGLPMFLKDGKDEYYKSTTVWARLKRKITSPPKEFNANGEVAYQTDDDGEVEEKIKLGTLTPIDSKSKSFYVHQWRSAEERRKKTIGEIILLVLPYVMCILILAILVFGYGDIVKSTNQFVASNQERSIEFFRELSMRRAELCGQIVTPSQPSQGNASASGVPN